MSSIRDKSKVDAFSRELAGHDRRRHRAGPRGGTAGGQPPPGRARRDRRRRADARRASPTAPRCPTRASPGSRIERETLKLVLQHPGAVGPDRPPTSAPTTSPTRPSARCGSWSRRTAARRAADAGWAGADPRRRRRPRRPVGGQRPRRGAAEDRQGARRGLRGRPRLPAPGAHRAAPDRRGEVAAPAHQPGRPGHRVQPDVRRAGRPRAAPPHPARAGDGHASEAASPSARASRSRRGSGCSPGPRRRPARCWPARARRCTSPAYAVWPGRTSRPPTGTATPRCSGWPRSAPGASAAPSTATRSASRAGCWSWSASGSRPACCWSGTCPSNGRRGVRVIARRAPAGDRALRWVYEYDEGIDPDDPAVRLAAETALASRAGRGRADRARRFRAGLRTLLTCAGFDPL